MNWTDKGMYGCMDGWMDGYMDGYTANKCVEKYLNERLSSDWGDQAPKGENGKRRRLIYAYVLDRIGESDQVGGFLYAAARETKE